MSAVKVEQNGVEWKNKGVYSKISKFAVSDSNLPCDAKALYALLCTYGAMKGSSTAGVQTLCKDLNVNSKKLGGLLLELSSQGYIEITRLKEKGRFAGSSYKIVACPAKYHDMMPKDSKDAYALNKIKAGGIQSYAYGLTEQRVLRDPELHIKAKAVYAYFCAFAGNTNTAYPSIKAVLRDLRISENTYYKYISQLVGKGYVQVVKHIGQDGRYSPNEFILLGHPNRLTPSNYEKNIGELNRKNAPKNNDPYRKSDARQTAKKLTEINETAQSHEPETAAEPGFTKPSVKNPSLKKDAFSAPPTTPYNINNININNQKKNTINQEGRKNSRKSFSDGKINQSKKSAEADSDSIDKTDRESFSVNPDKILADLRNSKGIPVSCLKNKAYLEFIVKMLSDNANTPKNPSDNPLRRLILKCLADMLYDSGSSNRKYSPQVVAELLNTHIKFSISVISFDNWLEQFEKSFLQSASKPNVADNISNIYPYVKTSLWKFLDTYKDMHFEMKSNGSDSKQSSSGFNSDLFFDKIARNSKKLLE